MLSLFYHESTISAIHMELSLIHIWPVSRPMGRKVKQGTQMIRREGGFRGGFFVSHKENSCEQ